MRVKLPTQDLRKLAKYVQAPADCRSLSHFLKTFEVFYPALKEVKLLDYKVRVLAAAKGTAAGVRVLIESGDGKMKWGTVGVSEDVVEASYQALLDSIEYKLLKEGGDINPGGPGGPGG